MAGDTELQPPRPPTDGKTKRYDDFTHSLCDFGASCCPATTGSHAPSAEVLPPTRRGVWEAHETCRAGADQAFIAEAPVEVGGASACTGQLGGDGVVADGDWPSAAVLPPTRLSVGAVHETRGAGADQVVVVGAPVAAVGVA